MKSDDRMGLTVIKGGFDDDQTLIKPDQKWTIFVD